MGVKSPFNPFQKIFVNKNFNLFKLRLVQRIKYSPSLFGVFDQLSIFELADDVNFELKEVGTKV